MYLNYSLNTTYFILVTIFISTTNKVFIKLFKMIMFVLLYNLFNNNSINDEEHSCTRVYNSYIKRTTLYK